MSDDFDEEVIDTGDEFDEFSQGSGFADSVRGSPVVKILVVVVALLVVGGVLVLFSGERVEEQRSVVPQGEDVTSVPGTGDRVVPAYVDAVEQQNEDDLQRAIAQGGSSIPVPTDTTDTRLEVPEIEEESEDPLHRWRLLQAERVEREMKTREVDVEPVTVLNAEQQAEAINQLAGSMLEQMESVLEKSDGEESFSTKTLITYDEVSGEAGVGGVPAGGDTSQFVEDEEVEVVIPAGRIVYGQMLLEANSDVPSVLLAQMVSGPLKGWKLLGQFALEEDLEMLTVTFNLAVNEDGDQYEVNAVMLDPDTSLAALASDVNHRYLRRIVFPAAAAFVQGFAEAVSESGRTTVTVDGGAAVGSEDEKTDKQQIATGVVEAGEKVSEILDDMGDVPIQVILAAGTPIGIFFTQNVVETESDI